MSETTTIERAERERRDMAVAIARDVIAQIRAGDSYRIESGVYIEVGDIGTIPDDCDLREHFAEVAPECSVCMLGAAFLSLAHLYDRVPVVAVRDWDAGELKERLAEVFDPATLGLMECAFECNPGFGAADLPQSYGAAVFGFRYGDENLRAVAIAENIIANDGRFVVPDATFVELDAAAAASTFAAHDEPGDFEDDFEDFEDEDEDEDFEGEDDCIDV